uniref:Cyclic nucleotide-binding domain-containing protein n=1 Tax=Anopheles dirus TaxID=7168 RepID=A0A182N002_9DIPT
MGDAATRRLSYEQLRETLKRFEYFRHWTEEQIRECSVLARVVQYAPHQTIPLDLPLPFAYLVLSGQCMILQCLQVARNGSPAPGLVPSPGTPDPGAAPDSDQLDQIRGWHETFRAQFATTPARTSDVEDGPLEPDATICFLTTPPPERCVRQQFVDVGTLGCGAVFGLGERHQHRTIVARTSTQCLLIPRCWLFLKRQNIGNTWQRLCMYLDWAVPSRGDLFQGFLRDQRWLDYRRWLVGVTAKRRSGTVPADVPIMCRLAESTSAAYHSTRDKRHV